MDTSTARIGKSNNTSSSFRLRCPSLNSVRLRRIFDLFDKNHDGTITVQELSQAFQRLGLDANQSELEDMVKSHVKPGNIGLQFEEFECLHATLNDTFFGTTTISTTSSSEDSGSDSQQQVQDGPTVESDLKEAFKVFDENGDGYISARELQTVLEKLGLGEEGREMGKVEKMICSVDRNRDGQVDFSEFKDMMRTVIVSSS